jgi:uncharacterized protein (TIGR02246 family)
MRAALNITGAALALGIILVSFASNALVGPKEEVAEVTQAWARALGEDDPDKVLPFYADDAVFWGTLSPTVRADRAALRDYFVTAFRVLPGLKVAFGDQLIRVYGNTAVNTGYYTFSYIKDGETKSLPARYSFTYVKNGEPGSLWSTIHQPCRPLRNNNASTNAITRHRQQVSVG